MTSPNHDQPQGGGLLLAACCAGGGLLVVLCCAAPALIAGGALAGIGGFFGNPWVVGAGIALLILAIAAMTLRKRPAGLEPPDCCPATPPATDTSPNEEQDR